MSLSSKPYRVRTSLEHCALEHCRSSTVREDIVSLSSNPIGFVRHCAGFSCFVREDIDMACGFSVLGVYRSVGGGKVSGQVGGMTPKLIPGRPSPMDAMGEITGDQILLPT